MSNITQIGDLNFNKTLALTPDKCENLCSEDDETKDYCENLWKEMEFENHLKFVITLAVLFIFSSIEGLLDGCFSWTPYNILHNYKFPDRVVARSKNQEEHVVLDGDNVAPLIELGLTDLPKTGNL
jgi:hypothetical protein